MADKDLHSIVQTATETNKNNKMNKVQLGYTVDTYNGVLADLQQIGEIDGGGIREGARSVFGDDYTGLSDMSFNNLNFSVSDSAAIWKMEMRLKGALPIEYVKEKKFDIIPVKGTRDEYATFVGNQYVMPTKLLTESPMVFTPDKDLEHGVFMDIDDHLVKYFNNFFIGPNTAGKFDTQMVRNLVANKCLVAQIIPKNGSDSVQALIIGKSTVTNSSQLQITPTMFATTNFSIFNVPLTISNEGQRIEILPSKNGDYRCPIDGDYNIKSGFIRGADKQSYKNWLGRSAHNSNDAHAFVIDQIDIDECYVRVFVPQNKVEIANKYLPRNVDIDIYKTYNTVRHGSGRVIKQYNEKVSRMMRCIDSICVRNNYHLFTQDMIQTARGFSSGMVWTNSFNTSNVGAEGKGQWSKSKDINKAMKGEFIIPEGWPMCVIEQNYTIGASRSPSDQAKKGLEGQAGNSSLLPWIIAQDGRMDRALNSLSSDALSGNMSDEWYKQRIEKSKNGVIRIKCNLVSASKFNNLFEQTLHAYNQAAALYNINLPLEQQVTGGEIMLRCAPCLCAINGANAIHRSRSGRTNGHDAGCAIDFDPTHNDATSSKEENLTREITSGMEVAYRPFLHFLYKNDGFWGGSYPFMSGKYDAMHIQF